MCRQQVSVPNNTFMPNSVAIVDVALRHADCLFLQGGAAPPVPVERKAVRDLVGSKATCAMNMELVQLMWSEPVSTQNLW